MAGPILKSALATAAEKFPDTFKTKSATNMLKKQGVKDEELTFSGVGQKLAKAEELGMDKVSKDALEAAIPEGQFGEQVQTGSNTLYDWVSVEDVSMNPTYKERIITFGEEGRYTSSHFPTDGGEGGPTNYLMHNRVFDKYEGTTGVRVLQEIQSDLHQQGRQRGYDDSNLDVPGLVDTVTRMYDSGWDEATAASINREFGLPVNTADNLEGITVDNADQYLSEYVPARAPKSPWEKTWLKKGIELEVADAAKSGLDQLEIPIKGPDIGNLQRAEGVQSWYETTVVNTAKKIAKSMGGEFELKETGAARTFLDITADRDEAKEVIFKAVREAHYPGMSSTEMGEVQARALADEYSISIDDARIMQDAMFTSEKAFEQLKHGLGEGSATAVIKFPKDELGRNVQPQFTLYAAAPATVMGVIAARQQGYSDEEIAQHLESQGLNTEDAFETADKVQKAKDAGYSDEEIATFLGSAPTKVDGVETELLDPAVDPRALSEAETEKAARYAEIVDTENAQMNLEQLVAGMKVIHPNMMSVTMRTAGFFGNEAAQRQEQEVVRAQAQRIVDETSKTFGIDLEWNAQHGVFYANLPNGKVEVTPGILDTLFSEGGELTGAIAGGIAGAYFGKKYGGSAWSMLLASMGGAAAGGALGTQADYLREAIELHQDFAADVMAHKAMTAAEASIIGDVVGMGVFKGLGKGWSFLDSTYQAIKDGNSKGAVQAIKEVLFVADDEAEELVTRLNKSLKTPLAGNKNQTAIQAIATTKQGSEAVVKAVGQIDPLAGTAAVKAIDDRAKDLNATAASLTDENVGRVLREDLVNYTDDVKAFYQSVKDEAAKSPYNNNFKFNFEKLALNPALEAVKRNLMSRGDSATLDRFTLQAQRINGMSESRSFTDLIELRQLVNDFLFNKKISNGKDREALMTVRDNIDGALDVGAKVVLRDRAPQWQANFAAAKKEYAKMKGLERNVMNKVLQRPGVSERAIAQGLTKYMTAIDGTFSDVVSKLPQSTRFKAEGAIVNSLTEKFTAGQGDGIRAVHFPLLDAELAKMSFTSPQARQYKAAVHQYAEIFKNDVPLAQVTGQIQIPKFQSYLTADPVVRAKFEIASGVFNTIKTFAPGKEQRNMAMVKNVAKLLETPLNSKAAKDVMAEYAGELDISAQVVGLQQEAARAAMKERDADAVLVKLFGEGRTKKLKGQVASMKIPMHRIATHADVKNVADADGIMLSDTASLDYALKQRGYLGIMQGADRVREIKQ